MRIGPHELSSNLFLSPLAGYTNLPMRLTVRELGGLGWATTDLVNARSLVERNAIALKLVASCAEDRPLAIQLFGSVPEEDARRRRHLPGTRRAIGGIDMGCLREEGRQHRRRLRDDDRARRNRRARPRHDRRRQNPRHRQDAPRLGRRQSHRPDLARVLEDVGVAAIFVHGRTRAQGFAGTVNLAGIRSVVQAVEPFP